MLFPGESDVRDVESKVVYLSDGNRTWRLLLCPIPTPLLADMSWSRDRYFSWRCLEPLYCWIRPVVPVSHSISPKVHLPRLRRGGVDLMNLRPLCHASRSAGDPTVVRIALVNSRSLVNKSFILNDFFTFYFLFVTETWINVGDLSPFSELVPPECTFFNYPRTSGPVLNCNCCKLI